MNKIINGGDILNNYWAIFEKRKNNFFRFDTRVYLNLLGNPTDKDICIGAVVGKNPGSALPSLYNCPTLQEIELDGDQLLPNIRSIFLKAYKRSNKLMQKNSYIQVLNLLYICNKDLSQAIKTIADYPNQIICDTEEKHFPFLWYLWGNDNKNLNLYKNRFYDLVANIHFYLDTNTKVIIPNYPALNDSARHTQVTTETVPVSVRCLSPYKDWKSVDDLCCSDLN